MTTQLDDKGISIVELLVVIIVGSLLTTVITGFALNYWTTSAVLQTDEQSLVSRLNAGDYLRNTIDASSGLINQNDLADNHVLDADPANASGLYWLPIHAVPQTLNIGTTGTITPVIYFNRPSLDGSKNIIMNGSIPYQDDIVIYMNGTTKQLLARTIANPSAPSNNARTSCPASIASNTCPADAVIAENVSSLTMSYYDRSGNAVNYQSIVDPITGNYIGPDFPSVQVVQIIMQLQRKATLHNGANTSNQTTIRIATRN